MDSTITNPDVLARLPHAGPLRVHWRWHWFRCLASDLRGNAGRKGAYWRDLWRTLRLHRMRLANAEIIFIGPIEIVRPMPWLAGPARQLHPEAFQ